MKLFARIYVASRTQPRLRYFLGIQLTALVDVQPVKLRFHESHPLFLGDLSVLIGVHEKQQLLNLFRSEREPIRRSTKRSLLLSCIQGVDPRFGKNRDGRYEISSRLHA